MVQELNTVKAFKGSMPMHCMHFLLLRYNLLVILLSAHTPKMYYLNHRDREPQGGASNAMYGFHTYVQNTVIPSNTTIMKEGYAWDVMGCEWMGTTLTQTQCLSFLGATGMVMVAAQTMKSQNNRQKGSMLHVTK